MLPNSFSLLCYGNSSGARSFSFPGMRVLAPFVFLAEYVIRYILARRFVIVVESSISEKGAKVRLFLRRADVRNHNSYCKLHCWVDGWNCNNTVEVLR